MEGCSEKAKRQSVRCSYIGGSDARIVLGTDENALIRLWKEKRGEIEPEDLSGNLLVQFGCATEDLNRRWFERETRRRLGGVQRIPASSGWAPPSRPRRGGDCRLRGQVHAALGVHRGERG